MTNRKTAVNEHYLLGFYFHPLLHLLGLPYPDLVYLEGQGGQVCSEKRFRASSYIDYLCIVRKATKSGLSVRWVAGEGIEEFYDVFTVNMRDLGLPVHSKAFFQSIQKELAMNCGLILVSKGEQTIGGGVCVKFKDTLCVPWASSLRQYGSLCPNNLLYWEALRWGCDNGLTRFDFGRSSPGGGTYQFKRQWGATEYPLHWQYGAEGRKQSHLDNESAKLQWFVKIWRGLPLPITKVVGPILRRQISN